MVRCGTMWFGGTAWSGVVRLVWDGMVRCGKMLYDAVWCGQVWCKKWLDTHSMVSHVWTDVVTCGMMLFGVVWHGQVW